MILVFKMIFNWFLRNEYVIVFVIECNYVVEVYFRDYGFIIGNFGYWEREKN